MEYMVALELFGNWGSKDAFEGLFEGLVWAAIGTVGMTHPGGVGVDGPIDVVWASRIAPCPSHHRQILAAEEKHASTQNGT